MSSIAVRDSDFFFFAFQCSCHIDPSNFHIKYMRCKPRLHELVLDREWPLHDLVLTRVWPPTIHATSHVDHERRFAWVSVFMHAYDPVPIVMVLRLEVLRAAGAPLKSLKTGKPNCNGHISWLIIGHFRVLLCLCFKASLSAKPCS